MSISAQDVKLLREKTGAGMMDCKKALQDANGNMDEAIEVLRKQGLAKAIKKGDRVAAEGLIFNKIEGSSGILLELNCETDFVAKNDDFIKLGQDLADLILKNKPKTVEEALQLKLDEQTCQEKINAHVAIIGENIQLRRFVILQTKQNGKLGLYVHSGGKICVLMEVTGANISDEIIRDVCMHVAAMNPQYTDASEVPQDLIDKEKQLQIEQLKDSGKPANMIEKIVEGKIGKFAGEISLMQQVFVKDSSGKKKVSQYLQESDPAAKVVHFARLQVGEGIEKKQEDFAEEVAKMVK